MKVFGTLKEQVKNQYTKTFTNKVKELNSLWT